MSFWNPAGIADALRLNQLSETTKVRYLIAGSMFQALVGARSVLQSRTMGDLVTALVGLGVLAFGIFACARTNARGDGRAFLERYICLSLPLSLAIYAGYFATYYAGYAILRASHQVTALSYQTSVAPFLSLLNLALVVVFFLLLRHYIGRAAGAAPTVLARPA